MFRLLIVDDEPIIANAMYDIISDLKEYDLDIYVAYSGEEAINWMKRTKIDIVLTDVSMPGISGLEIQKIVLEMWPRCKVIFLSGYNDFDFIQSAIRNEGYDYILKTEPEEVVIENNTTVEQMRLIQQLDEEDKQTIFRLIEKMLTNKKFKEFFQKNVAVL
jgi:two-component system response regulator YesN